MTSQKTAVQFPSSNTAKASSAEAARFTFQPSFSSTVQTKSRTCCSSSMTNASKVRSIFLTSTSFQRSVCSEHEILAEPFQRLENTPMFHAQQLFQQTSNVL